MSHFLGKLLLRALLLIVFVMLAGLIVLEPYSTSLFSLLLWQVHFVRTLIAKFTVQERLSRLRDQEPDHAAPSFGTTRSGSSQHGANGLS